jgi:hypothetical protein
MECNPEMPMKCSICQADLMPIAYVPAGADGSPESAKVANVCFKCDRATDMLKFERPREARPR